MTTNLSKEKREKIIENIDIMRAKMQDDTELVTTLNDIERMLKKKKYGLVWESHHEKNDDKLIDKIPVFSEVAERALWANNHTDMKDSNEQLDMKSANLDDKNKDVVKCEDSDLSDEKNPYNKENLINASKYTESNEKADIENSESKNYPMNFLIEGDNLHSLYLLEKTHKNAVDLIIIDPPYNRGLNDFIYDDNYIDTGDTFRHSKWLSFMSERLNIAKKLLKDNGAIFINIDDNEFAQLKLLCDEIFGEENFITCFPWHNRTSVQNDTDISVNHEYIIAYAKKRRQTNRRLKVTNAETWYKLDDFVIQPKETDSSKYSNPDNDERGIWKADPFDAPNIRPNLTYEIVNPNTGEKYLPPKGRCWRTEQEKYEKLLADGRIVFGKNGTSRPQLKVFYSDVKMKGEIRNSWFDSDLYDTSTSGKKELLSILPDKKIFNTPKPVKLYRELIKMSISPKVKNPVILDFFAGSGTVGQAVLEEFRGKDASFILCTNNESNICEEITYERLKRVIEGYTNSKGQHIEGIPANLKYYKVKYIDRFDRMDDDYYVVNELMKYTKEMATLEHFTDSNSESIQVINTDEKLDELALNEEKLKACNAIYLGSSALVTEQQIEKFENYNIKICYVPDYYFEKELMDSEQW